MSDFKLFLFVVAILEIGTTTAKLSYDDPEISDGPCVFPPAVILPTHLLVALRSAPQGFNMYMPMANKAYYRWQYQKVKNVAAETEAQLDSLKPRVIFPDLPGMLASGSFVPVKVTVFNPPSAYYKVQCIPNNLSMTNATCSVPEASPGSAPDDFGGFLSPHTSVWADLTAFTEWHCFNGVQIINTVSLNSTLTQEQIEANTVVLLKLGFKKENMQFQTY